MEVKPQPRPHRFELNARKSMTATGIRDVRSFDEQEIVLETDEDVMVIRGHEMHVGRLNTEKGEIDVTGIVDSILYTNAKGTVDMKKSLAKRLFR